MNTFSHIDTLLFDKTGTLTKGNTEVVVVKNYGASKELIDAVASAENESDHPLATAIVRMIGEFNPVKFAKTDVVKGQGIIADDLLIGNEKMMVANHITILPSRNRTSQKLLILVHQLFWLQLITDYNWFMVSQTKCVLVSKKPSKKYATKVFLV